MAEQDWEDTAQQKAILRQSKTARKVRKMYPAGTRIVVGDNMEKGQGEVIRHVPATNAQGGHLVVQLDTGVKARLSPISVKPLPKKKS